MRLPRARLFDAREPAVANLRIMALRFEQQPQRVGRVRIVVAQQDTNRHPPCGQRGSGTRSRKRTAWKLFQGTEIQSRLFDVIDNLSRMARLLKSKLARLAFLGDETKETCELDEQNPGGRFRDRRRQ